MRYLLDGNACFPQSLAVCVAIFVRLHDIIIERFSLTTTVPML